MKAIYQDYISLLKCFVHNTAPANREKVDYDKLIHLAGINSTDGIVNYVLLKAPDAVDAQYHKYMSKQCRHQIAGFSRRAQQMNILSAKLDEQGIDHLLFKGYVVKEYYTVPELRTFGDIDFVIRKEDRKRCHELMMTLGYETRCDWEPVYSYSKGSEYYEIHTDVMEIDVSDKADYKSYFSHIWEYTLANNHAHAHEFTPEFHFLYLLTHIAKHISTSGAGIRMYLDIAFFIKHFGDTIDWGWISEELKKLQFQDFANMVLTAVQEWFDISGPLPLKEISADTMEDFLDFTIEGGIFGKYGRDKNVIFLKEQNRSEAEVSKFKTLMFRIFPPVSSLKFRYSYLQKCPWLLPAAWVHRIVGNPGSWKRYLHHVRGIANADTEEALRLKKMYREIGL